jgi:hypothetical protein
MRDGSRVRTQAEPAGPNPPAPTEVLRHYLESLPRTLAVIGAPEPQVLVVATEFEQLCLLRLGSDEVTLLTTQHPKVLAQRRVTYRARRFCGCPMLNTWQTAEKLCQDVGSPYGLKAVHASAFWHSERRSLVPVVGCDVCKGGQIAGRYGASAGGTLLGYLSVANKLSEPRWLREGPFGALCTPFSTGEYA